MAVINKLHTKNKPFLPLVPQEHKGEDRDEDILNPHPSPLPEGERTVRITPKSLKILTAAALTLPGLLQTPAFAADEETSFTYGHYQEGHRNLFGAQSAFSPIEVESLQGSTKFKLTDRVKFAFNYVQDTWGGATPVTTAPIAAVGNSSNTNGDVITGATPKVKRDNQVFDKNFNILETVKDSSGIPLIDNQGNPTYKKANNRLVHTLAEASPEVRKQGDFKLTYEWDNAAIDLGGGLSIENDYESRFGNINTRWDFNQKQTTLNAGLSYTNSDTNATVDHDLTPYYEPDQNYDPIKIPKRSGDAQLIKGNRQDWSTALGLTQVINKTALLEAGLTYTRSTGYMANPYKVVSVAFVDPNQDPLNANACGFVSSANRLCGDIAALLEQRPDERNQWTGNLRYVQHIQPLDAAVHFGYRIFSDDWGITSHTFDADWVQPIGAGWSITPRIRYYSQDQANFYTPFVKSDQAKTSDAIDANGRQIWFDVDGNEIANDPNTGEWFDKQGNDITQAVNDGLISPSAVKTTPFDRNKLPKYFSSDQRLSGYGTLSGGVTLSKQFAKGIGLDLGFEYYTHQGSLKIGGSGEGNYADFDYWTANATLKVDLAALSFNGGSSGNAHAAHNTHQHGSHAPAGVMFDHMLPKAGDMMVGYRYMYGSQGGDMLHGAHPVSDLKLVDHGCGPNPCFVRPDSMSMTMHMLDLMYAPTDWMTLMLMPQFMDMSMDMARLDGAPPDSAANNNVGNPLDYNGNPLGISQHIIHHVQNGHETGGIGDLGMYAMFKLYDDGIHHAHITPGFSAPTGDVDIQLRRNHTVDGGFIHYGMQLGSGTWDFKPSVTYTGHVHDFSWGAQLNGTLRMESQNKSGYRLGDMFQATAWGSYNLTDWLTASVRGVYSWQGIIKGNFNGLINQFGPMDYTRNYGGKYWDVGFGFSATMPNGALPGNRVSVEYLHPVSDDINGYQLERDGALSATWSMVF